MKNNYGSIAVPFFGLIFIVATVIIAVGHFSGLDFGILGIISWVIVIVGAIAFILYAISSATS